MKVEFVEARLDHLLTLSPRLRPCESVKGFEQTAARELSRSLFAYAGLVDGECQAVWGVQTAGFLAEDGYVWLLGSKFVEEHPIVFLRHSKLALADLRENFKVLRGWVAADFICSKKWLNWLGFEIKDWQAGMCMFEMRV